ncbi:PVC-type heme-binding CxxCH protein [Planctomicrobium sp. SH527]|uniref:PVC-type heme-binding CxxCH protein n=1 Tax=Planctomicrobium sp. SH527 TaxID=3448123 RepID=UPI003F5BB93B
MQHFLRAATLLLGLLFVCCEVRAQKLEIPRRHDRPPGEPTSAEEAVRKMTVPEGFSVELVAAEPDVMNPVAMAIDEKGRYWVTESFEYPRHEPGPGRDRVKILEDTDGDGKVDKVTVFAEGLNIPSGIAVGNGGVWVVNAPDLLFLQDTDGDGKADKSEVIVTGFGRTDTHELPNSLTWGPDGWLYGLNGVYNYCKLSYPKSNPNYREGQKSFDFTCALYRIHPRTKEFQIFAEGTSNPWGLAFNEEGEFFISACVIDHLWHLVETGYYIRQGGPYPSHTWPMRSIVNHKHQKAAYCGIVWMDTDAFPQEYRNVLYMGNIHGGCLNADIVERVGSTFKGRPHPGFTPKPGAWDQDTYGVIAKTGEPEKPKLADLMTSNDPWFMPVAQKIGPDGNLYVLDWYDRYHCYQDAIADPNGIERSRGRLYRIRHTQTPVTHPGDLSKKSPAELIELLDGGNGYLKETAQRLLGEILLTDSGKETEQVLLGRVQDTQRNVLSRLRSLWALNAGDALDANRLATQVPVDQPLLHAWRNRLLADRLPDAIAVKTLVGDVVQNQGRDSRVLLQNTIAIGKLLRLTSLENDVRRSLVAAAIEISRLGADDPILQQIVWANLKPTMQQDPALVARQLAEGLSRSGDQGLVSLLNWSLQVVCDSPSMQGDVLATLLAAAQSHSSIQTQSACLAILNDRAVKKTISEDKISAARQFVSGWRMVAETSRNATLLNAIWGDADAQRELRTVVINRRESPADRAAALQTLMAVNDQSVLDTIQDLISEAETAMPVRTAILDNISRINNPRVAEILITNFHKIDVNLRPKVIEVLTQRPMWSVALLKEIDAGRIDKSLVNQNQLARINAFQDEQLKPLVLKLYGSIRAGVKQDRQLAIGRTRDFLHGSPGDPFAGVKVFQKTCAQCHKIYGEGAEVGPDITRNGRNDWNQLLQNVLDPSAVIGPGFQARIIATEDGRVLTGLPVEDSPERVVLKIQGGKLETIPRSQIEADKLSELSMMPDELERTMTPQELADLFAFLALDLPPEAPNAKLLPGAPQQRRR